MEDTSRPVVSLNEVHSSLISDYLRFCKYQLSQRLKSIDYCFTSLLACRIRGEETYTGDEVSSILTELQDVVRGEVDTELTDGVHTNALFVQGLLAQAEEWHLTLSGNVGELENRESLNAIKMFDSSEDKQKVSITVTKQTIPVEDKNLMTALKLEIARLNKAMSQNTTKDEDSGSQVSLLEAELALKKEEIRGLKAQRLEPPSTPEDSTQKLRIVQEAVDTLSKELERTTQRAEEEREKLTGDLRAREDKLRQVQSSLLLKEKELDKKFQATSAYMNMKRLLQEKNDRIKRLRGKLNSLGAEEEEDALSPPSNKDDAVLGEDEGFSI